jgi:hypothetical protein
MSVISRRPEPSELTLGRRGHTLSYQDLARTLPCARLEVDPLSEGGESCIQGAVWGRLASNGVVGATIADTFVFGHFFQHISL